MFRTAPADVPIRTRHAMAARGAFDLECRYSISGRVVIGGAIDDEQL
jgi:hypothetical protein